MVLYYNMGDNYMGKHILGGEIPFFFQTQHKLLAWYYAIYTLPLICIPDYLLKGIIILSLKVVLGWFRNELVVLF